MCVCVCVCVCLSVHMYICMYAPNKLIHYFEINVFWRFVINASLIPVSEVLCPGAPQLPNAQTYSIIGNNNTVGSVLQYVCSPGFQ